MEAETDGFPWIARLARGAGDAVLVAQGAPAWRTAALEDLLMSCEEAGDLWGAALLQLGVGVAGVVGGEPAARGSLLAASSRFAALDAPVLQCWADCLAALDAAVRQAPGAVAGARHAADHAAAQEIRGAHALALAALALADPGDRSAAIQADELAGACGLRMATTRVDGTASARRRAAHRLSATDSSAATWSGGAARPRLRWRSDASAGCSSGWTERRWISRR